MPWADKHHGYPAASCLSRSGGSGGHSILLSKALASQPVVSADKSMDPGALVHSVGLSPEVELCRGVRTGGIQGPTLWGGTSCSLSEPQFPTLWNVHYSKQAAKAQARSRAGAGYQDTASGWGRRRTGPRRGQPFL